MKKKKDKDYVTKWFCGTIEGSKFLSVINNKEVGMELSQARTALKEIDRDTLEGLIKRFGEDLVTAYQKEGYALADMEDASQGEYDSDEEFAQEQAEMLGEVDRNLSWPMNCIDWEWAARELMMDYHEINGHYFRIL